MNEITINLCVCQLVKAPPGARAPPAPTPVGRGPSAYLLNNNSPNTRISAHELGSGFRTDGAQANQEAPPNLMVSKIAFFGLWAFRSSFGGTPAAIIWTDAPFVPPRH